MIPETLPNHQGVPASLPAVSPVQASPAQSGSNAVPAPDGDAAAHYAVKIKQLVSQYNSNPHGLAEALNQLKATYLAEQHHITPNQAGS